MTFQEQYLTLKWQKTRLRIFERDAFSCVKCSDDESQLHIHHLEYNKQSIFVDDDKLVTLCENCHELQTLMYNAIQPKLRTLFITFPNFYNIASCDMVDKWVTFKFFSLMNDEKYKNRVEKYINKLFNEREKNGN